MGVTLVMDREQTAIANDDVTLNPNNELEGPAEGDPDMKVEEGLDESADRDVSEIESNVGNEIAVEGHVDNFKLVGLQEGQEMEAEEQDMKVEEGLNESADHGVSEIESNVGNEIAVEGHVDNFELVGLQEGQEMEAEEQDMKVEEGLNESADRAVSEIESNVGNEIAVEGRVDNFELVGLQEGQEMEAEKQDMKVEEGLNESADHDVSEIESNVRNEIAVEGRVDNFKLVGLQEGQEMEAEEQDMKVEEGLNESADCDVSEIESNVVNEIAVEGRVHNFELVGLQEGSADRDVSEIESNVVNEIAVEGRVHNFELVGLQEGQEMEANEQDMKVEEGLNESADRDVSEIESNVGNEIAVEGRVDNFELVGLQEGQEMEAEEQDMKVEEGLNESADCDVFEIESNVENEIAVEERVDNFELVGLQEGQEMEAEEQDTNSKQPKITEEKSAKQATLNPGSTVKAHQASYQLPLDDEGEFTVSDLVWGKVRSHPWWPGQIFDPSYASEKAMKYHKKDCFLVAYFGDRTFAWNEASLLKPFRSHFSEAKKQSNSETFQNAVNCALEEVSRRAEFGLACSCISEDIYDKIKIQMVENTGIQQESIVRVSVDKSLLAHLFEPGKLVEYMKALALSPAGGADQLELVIAKSQLLAFYRLKGYSQLPKFQFCGGLLENAETSHFEDEVIVQKSPVSEDDGQISSGQETLPTQRSSYHKRKHNLKDTIYPRKKEKCMSELMGDSWDSVDDEIDLDSKANNKFVSPSFGKKRKGSEPFADDSSMLEGRKTISLAKVSMAAPPLAKPSFKIGECIRRVASQMTGSLSILKANNQKQDGSNDGLVGGEFDVSFHHSEDAEMRRMVVPTEYSSLDELLSQLHLAAQDPLKGYNFLTIIISFFSDFRNSVIMEQHDKVGGKRRHSIGGPPGTFEFEDMSDTYWRDRVIQNGSEEQPTRQSRKLDNLFVPVDLDKPVSKSNSRKRYSDGNYGQSTKKPAGYVDEKAPAELIMHFPVVDSVPSETSLSKMFRHFGPLKESETEVDKFTNRARVVFKKCSDAEAAYDSALKFNIFGSMLVNYQLNYTITMPFKTEPVAIFQEEDAALFLQY